MRAVLLLSSMVVSIWELMALIRASMAGIRNPIVLPVPVLALTSKSLRLDVDCGASGSYGKTRSGRRGKIRAWTGDMWVCLIADSVSLSMTPFRDSNNNRGSSLVLLEEVVVVASSASGDDSVVGFVAAVATEKERRRRRTET